MAGDGIKFQLSAYSQLVVRRPDALASLTVVGTWAGVCDLCGDLEVGELPPDAVQGCGATGPAGDDGGRRPCLGTKRPAPRQAEVLAAVHEGRAPAAEDER